MHIAGMYTWCWPSTCEALSATSLCSLVFLTIWEYSTLIEHKMRTIFANVNPSCSWLMKTWSIILAPHMTAIVVSNNSRCELLLCQSCFLKRAILMQAWRRWDHSCSIYLTTLHQKRHHHTIQDQDRSSTSMMFPPFSTPGWCNIEQVSAQLDFFFDLLVHSRQWVDPTKQPQ